MKHAEDFMDVLRYYDLPRSLRAAADLASWSPNTMARDVAARDEAGGRPAWQRGGRAGSMGSCRR